MLPVWQYSSGLELESSRFSQPGDFFVYIIFLGLVILVCKNFLLLMKLSTFAAYFSFCFGTSYICPPSLMYLAEAVPGTEEDHPCISHLPIIRNPYKRAYVRCRHGGKGQLR